MITEDQTLCPKCKIQFSELNPPRLLTMCGHTFCEKCVKELVLKKKINNKYKLICPLDKMSIQLITSNPSSFPKNLSLLNLVKKRIENSLVDNRISDIIKYQPQQFGSDKTLSNIQNQLGSHANLSTTTIQKESKKQQATLQQISSDTCLLHQKPLQLVCVRDCQKICASCVIFGQHRGHTVKNATQVQQLTKNLSNTLKGYLKQEKAYFGKLQSKEVEHKLESMIQKKKHDLDRQIVKKFKQIIDHVAYIEKKTLSKLDKKMDEYKTKIKTNLSQKLNARQKYRDWQDTLNDRILLLSGQNQQQKLKITLKSEGFVETCQRNLSLLKLIQTQLFNETQKMLDNLVLHTNDEQFKKFIKQYCKFEDCTNSFLDMSNSRINFTSMLQEQSLLDDLHDPDHSLQNSVVKENNKSEKAQSRIKKVQSNLTCVTQSHSKSVCGLAANKLNRVRSSNKQTIFKSPGRHNSNLKSSKMLGTLTGNNKLVSMHNTLKSKDIPQKYQSKIQAVVKGGSDVLDLTNGELGNQKIIAILQSIKDSPCTIVKLVKNRLNDECFIKCIPFLNNIVMLNISRNQLTSNSIQQMLRVRKQGGLKCLKSLMLGQNKIVERKHKQMFDELKKLGINVCI